MSAFHYGIGIHVCTTLTSFSFSKPPLTIVGHKTFRICKPLIFEKPNFTGLKTNDQYSLVNKKKSEEELEIIKKK